MIKKFTFNKLFIKYFLLFTFSFSFIFLATYNFPFFQHDFINIYFMNGEWNYSKLGVGFEFYFRPLENFVFFIFLKFFGITTLPFRIFKAIVSAGVFCLIYYYIKKYSQSEKMALLGSLFYITSPGVLASIFLIYDFEIVMQLLILISFYFLIDVFEKNEFDFKKISIFLLLIYLAELTKESSKVFIGAITSFLFLFNKKNLKMILLFSILIFFALKPEFFLGLSSSQTSNMFSILLQWALFDNLVIFLKNFLWLSFGVLASILLVLPRLKINKISLFWGVWFLLTSISALFIPMSEARYLAVQFLPFTLFVFTLIGKRFSENVNLGKYTKIILTIFIVTSILFNGVVSFKYVYGQMNFYRIIDDAHEFFENGYNNSTLVFFGSDTFFYPMISSKNNNSYVARQEIINRDLNKTFFLEGTSKNRRGALEKHFIIGPYCLMIYGVEKNKSTQCSVELKTKFIYPQDIWIEFIGEQKKETIQITPPIGKQVNCEYLCPEFNESFKIKLVNVTTTKNNFNKLIDFKIHLKQY